jgi:hypothetical protein
MDARIKSGHDGESALRRIVRLLDCSSLDAGGRRFMMPPP